MDLSIKILIFNFNKFTSFFIFIFVCVFFSLLLNINPVYPEEQNGINDSPILITSDKMIGEKGASMVEFIGNVEAKKEDSIILADSMKVYFVTDKKKNKKNETQSNITKIVSTGNVRYTSGERKAFADEAVYTTSDDILVLKGNSPRLVTGTSFITGKKITLYRKQDKVIVESDSQKRVEALLNPEDNPGKKE
ncbi:MAG: lipopolysaccharide transporter LptA [Desulfobacterales bacterium RIFOXYA12_FULL_46_15]|nr:MAG: lipopolysaccharide transporter LptA [Desulfobacula sp. GWF2_41_7]OGR22205.1 MAG: lipopolysaccharide transporter LptA [Desulfobacterales bacterium RIFOXYA12_FULL_46_15]